MVFKNYKIKFIVRVLVLTLAITAFVYSVLILHKFIRSLFAFAFCIIAILELLQFINKANRDFKSFLNALIYEDFTNHYSKIKERESEVYNLFNQLNNKYRKIAFEKEVQHAFLQTIVEHINIALIVLKENNSVVLANDYFKKLLNIQTINSIHDIASKSEKIEQEIVKVEVGKSKLVEFSINNEIYRVSIKASDFKLDGVRYRLVSLQDINVELDEQEIIAWQKLIRVLTHEIMNSVTPISSLSSSLNKLLTDAIRKGQVDSKHLEYMSNGLNAVQERSEGLIKFTEAYKKLTQLKHPEFEYVELRKIFENVCLLHKSKLESLKIETIILVDEDISVFADKVMLEQVMINLVKNSIQAFDTVEKPKIKLKCFKEENSIIIQVIDNGIGIAKDKIDKIFIPFFTTKESGSGIGLSLAKQVMQLHKGSINVKSVPGNTVITLKF